MSNVIAIEEIDLTGDDGEDEALNFTPLADGVTPGLLLTVKQASGISAPYIENGTVYLPPGGGSVGDLPLAYFGLSGIYSPVAGIISNMYFTEQVKEPRAYAGEVALPVAYFDGSSSPVTGGVKSIRFASFVSKPQIIDGEIYIPPSSNQLAYFEKNASSPVAGVLQGLEFEGDLENPRAYNGVVYFPKAYFLPSQIGRPGVVQSVEVDDKAEHPYILNGRMYLTPSGGGLKGLTASDGTQIAWNELNYGVGDASVLDSILIGGQQVQLIASYNEGFLKIGFNY